MSNYLIVILVMFEKLGHLTSDEAKKLTKELTVVNIPDNYESVERLVADLFTRFEIDTVKNKTAK